MVSRPVARISQQKGTFLNTILDVCSNWRAKHEMGGWTPLAPRWRRPWLFHQCFYNGIRLMLWQAEVLPHRMPRQWKNCLVKSTFCIQPDTFDTTFFRFKSTQLTCYSIFFSLQSRRLTTSFEHLISSLAQSTGESMELQKGEKIAWNHMLNAGFWSLSCAPAANVLYSCSAVRFLYVIMWYRVIDIMKFLIFGKFTNFW